MARVMRTTDIYLYRGVVKIHCAGNPDAEHSWHRKSFTSIAYFGPYADSGQASGQSTRYAERYRRDPHYTIETWVERLPCEMGQWERRFPEVWTPRSGDPYLG